MLIEKATYSDLEACHLITKCCANEMINNGEVIWNKTTNTLKLHGYPIQKWEDKVVTKIRS